MVSNLYLTGLTFILENMSVLTVLQWLVLILKINFLVSGDKIDKATFNPSHKAGGGGGGGEGLGWMSFLVFMCNYLIYYPSQDSHIILKLKIQENRGDMRRNFVKFEDNLEKNRRESRRFFLHFQTKSRKIEQIFHSQ